MLKIPTIANPEPLCGKDKTIFPVTKTPNYIDMGFGSSMGPKLKKLVEEHLTADLKHYGVDNQSMKFDWSESCIEGRCTDYLDGSVDCYSGIFVFDQHDNLLADGWMEFIHEGEFFLVYWDMVTTYSEAIIVTNKKIGIPEHVWAKIPDDIKPNYIKDRQKSRTA